MVRKVKDCFKIGKLVFIGSLIHTYKHFKNNKKKVFVARDFHTSWKVIRTHLFALEKLGLIEQVDAFYKYGSKYTAIKCVKGYKFLK